MTDNGVRRLRCKLQGCTEALPELLDTFWAKGFRDKNLHGLRSKI